MKQANIIIDEDLNIHKVAGFEGFNRESVGTQYISARLDGWALTVGETLHLAFKSSNYTVAPILLAFDLKNKTYFTEVPIEVMALAGEWQIQAHKKYNWNVETGKADKTVAGNIDVFYIKDGIEDINGNAVTECDIANLYKTALQTVDKSTDEANAAAQSAKEAATSANQSANNLAGARAAQSAAETARQGAETAQRKVEEQTDLSLINAQSSAQSATESAESAIQSEQSRQAAETARMGAETAETNAGNYAKAAQESAVSAEESAKKAEAAGNDNAESIQNIVDNETKIGNSQDGFYSKNTNISTSVEYPGAALGAAAEAQNGGAVGRLANTHSGGAIGQFAKSTLGGAAGQGAATETGGSVGNGAKSKDGFAGGNNAKATAAGAVQLGEGANETANTLQFRGFRIINANGMINDDRLANVGSGLTLTVDNTTFVITASLTSPTGQVLSTQSVDLPLETVVVNGEYNASTKSIVLTLTNGNKITVPVGSLIEGLVNESQLTAETNARKAADTTLQNNINAETTARQNAVTELEDGKLDKVTSAGSYTRAYTVGSTGSQAMINVNSAGATAKSIVQRTDAGAIFTGAPTDNAHATPKSYVDAADTALGMRIDNVVNGTTVVGKTTADGDGNNISSTYARMYKTIRSLGLSYPCTTLDIMNAMVENSICVLPIEISAETVTDALSYGLLHIIRASSGNRADVTYQRSLSNDHRQFEGIWTFDTTIKKFTSITWREFAMVDGTYPNMTVGTAQALISRTIGGSSTDDTWFEICTVTRPTGNAHASEILLINGYRIDDAQRSGIVEIDCRASNGAWTYKNVKILAGNIGTDRLALYEDSNGLIHVYIHSQSEQFRIITLSSLSDAVVTYTYTNTSSTTTPTGSVNAVNKNYAAYDGGGNAIATTYAKKTEITNIFRYDPALAGNPPVAGVERFTDSLNNLFGDYWLAKQYDYVYFLGADGVTANYLYIIESVTATEFTARLFADLSGKIKYREGI